MIGSIKGKTKSATKNIFCMIPLSFNGLNFKDLDRSVESESREKSETCSI